MKITPHEILKNAVPQKTQTGEKTSEGKFGEILQQTLENTSTSTGQAIGPPQVHSIPEIRFDPISPDTRTQITARVKEFLNIFEEYQTKLGDPEMSLKDINPVISRLDDQTKDLLPLLDSLPEGDGMRDILNNALIHSTLEVAKFNRGDYVS